MTTNEEFVAHQMLKNRALGAKALPQDVRQTYYPASVSNVGTDVTIQVEMQKALQQKALQQQTTLFMSSIAGRIRVLEERILKDQNVGLVLRPNDGDYVSVDDGGHVYDGRAFSYTTIWGSGVTHDIALSAYRDALASYILARRTSLRENLGQTAYVAVFKQQGFMDATALGDNFVIKARLAVVPLGALHGAAFRQGVVVRDEICDDGRVRAWDTITGQHAVAGLSQSSRKRFWRELYQLVEETVCPAPDGYEHAAWAMERATPQMVEVAYARTVGVENA